MSFFWNGYILRDFIFYNFNTSTIPGFIGVFIALFSVGVLYEALFYLKKDLLHKHLHSKSSEPPPNRLNPPASEALEPSENDETTAVVVTPDNGVAGNASNPRNSLLAGEDLPDVVSEVVSHCHSSSPPAGGGDGPPINYRNRERISSFLKWLGIAHPQKSYLFISSVLHGCYAFIGYTLMNAVMTFNIWVLIAICAGIGVGYLFFRVESPAISQQKRSSNSSSSQPFRNAIETDDDEFPSENERDPLDRSPSSSTKTKTDNTPHLQSPSKNCPSSPSGGSKGSRSSSGGGQGRRSRNRERAADYHQQQKINREESPQKNNLSSSPLQDSPPPAAQVIIVGAQVHTTYQQSV